MCGVNLRDIYLCVNLRDVNHCEWAPQAHQNVHQTPCSAPSSAPGLPRNSVMSICAMSMCVCVCVECVCVAGRRAWWEGRIERIPQQKQEPHTLMWGIMLWGCRAPETCLPTKYMAGVVLRSVARKRCVSALESDFKLCQGCVLRRVSRRIATSTVAAQAM